MSNIEFSFDYLYVVAIAIGYLLRFFQERQPRVFWGFSVILVLSCYAYLDDVNFELVA